MIFHEKTKQKYQHSVSVDKHGENLKNPQNLNLAANRTWVRLFLDKRVSEPFAVNFNPSIAPSIWVETAAEAAADAAAWSLKNPIIHEQRSLCLQGGQASHVL